MTTKGIYKSGRGDTPPEGAVELKTLCSQCQQPLTCYWPPECEFGGVKMSAAEAMAKTIANDSCAICCDDCLEEMPDANFEDTIQEERPCPTCRGARTVDKYTGFGELQREQESCPDCMP